MLAKVKFLILALAVLSFSSLAAAQMNPFGTSGFTIDDADLEAMSTASAPIYANPAPPAGTKAEWSNPTSGNSGTVTLVEAFEHQGLPCRKLHYTFKIKDVATDFSFIQDRCQVKSGQWKTL
ncbi:MAG: RT0821/Lpp0805 family surface protein [Kiloniellales bacterium]